MTGNGRGILSLWPFRRDININHVCRCIGFAGISCRDRFYISVQEFFGTVVYCRNERFETGGIDIDVWDIDGLMTLPVRLFVLSLCLNKGTNV